MFSVKISG